MFYCGFTRVGVVLTLVLKRLFHFWHWFSKDSERAFSVRMALAVVLLPDHLTTARIKMSNFRKIDENYRTITHKLTTIVINQWETFTQKRQEQ